MVNRLIEKDLPLRIADIKGDYLRERIEKNGCCGATELLKLYSWSFTEYHRVVHLDMDSLMLGPMDELFEMDKDLIYTCDYGMMTKGSAACPVQGGFIVVKPSLAVFGELVDTVLEGDYRDGGAWGGTHIGWFWGGMTIQGTKLDKTRSNIHRRLKFRRTVQASFASGRGRQDAV